MVHTCVEGNIFKGVVISRPKENSHQMGGPVPEIMDERDIYLFIHLFIVTCYERAA
jgi:hypothetical protein